MINLSLTDLLNNLKMKTILIYMFLFSTIISPGILYLYLFNNKMFLALTHFKLSVVASSLTIPTVSWNTFLFDFLFKPVKEEDKQEYWISVLLARSCVLTMAIYIGMILVKYLYGISDKSFVLYILMIEIALTIIVAIIVLIKQIKLIKTTNDETLIKDENESTDDKSFKLWAGIIKRREFKEKK